MILSIDSSQLRFLIEVDNLETNKNLFKRSSDRYWMFETRIQLRMMWQPQHNDDSCLRGYVGLDIDQELVYHPSNHPLFFSQTYQINRKRSYLMALDRQNRTGNACPEPQGSDLNNSQRKGGVVTFCGGPEALIDWWLVAVARLWTKTHETKRKREEEEEGNRKLMLVL